MEERVSVELKLRESSFGKRVRGATNNWQAGVFLDFCLSELANHHDFSIDSAT